MELDNPDKAPRRVGLARKAVPLRLEPELIAEIDAAAKAIDTNRTYFIEDAIKARLHLAKSYVAMDKGPPKKAKGWDVKISDGVVTSMTPIKPGPKAKGAKPVKLTGGAVARKPIGWDASGEPIYRGK